MATSHGMSVCWFSAAQVCACIDTINVSTGYDFLQFRYAFHSTVMVSTARVCADSFHSMCVYWLCPPTAHVCAGSFHSMCVLVMVPHDVCVGSSYSTCVYWLCPPTVRVCVCVLAVFTVRVCTD